MTSADQDMHCCPRRNSQQNNQLSSKQFFSPSKSGYLFLLTDTEQMQQWW